MELESGDVIHLKRTNNIIDLKTCQEEFRKAYLAELLQAEANAYGNQDAKMMKFLGQKATKFELDAWRQSEEQKAAYVKCMKGLTGRVNAGSFQLTKFDCINPSDEHRIGSGRSSPGPSNTSVRAAVVDEFSVWI